MIREELKTGNFLSTEGTMAKELFAKFSYPWEVLPEIGEYIRALQGKLNREEYLEIKPSVLVHRTARVWESVYFAENIIIGAETELRHGAFLRGNILVGAGAVVGNSCELKNVILFDHVQAPHYNYLGDSILGVYSHMGAASLTSNVKSDKSLVQVHAADGEIETGLKKFGAILSEHVEVGCGSVLNPGTMVGRNTNIYPLSPVRGCIDADRIYKSEGNVVLKRE